MQTVPQTPPTMSDSESGVATRATRCRATHCRATHCDVLIVGSGYGASVAAARLACAGHNVTVLERGRRWRPGDFPRRLPGAARTFHVRWRGRRLVGRSDSLFQLDIGDSIAVLTGSGIGGTSLINANVLLQPEPDVWSNPRWPTALLGDDGKPDASFQAAEQRALHMLGATRATRWEGSPKTRALIEGGYDATIATLAVTMSDGPNGADVFQTSCTGCGNCVAGCNVGAKNTVDRNYLALAQANGATIRERHEVISLRRNPAENRWVVTVDVTEPGSRRKIAGFVSIARRRVTRRELTADKVILGAGAIGSTTILKRSARDVRLSDRLGSCLTGNGDVLGFVFDPDRDARAIADHRDAAHIGPTITAIADVPEPEGQVGWLVQDGAIPSALRALIAPMLWFTSIFNRQSTGGRAAVRRRLARLVAPLSGTRRGPAARTLTLLGMGQDADIGTLELRRGQPMLRWASTGQKETLDAAHRAMRQIAASLNGRFVPAPTVGWPFGNVWPTVHPLGGCDMANTVADGVVDHLGRVFVGAPDSGVHPGLYVLDGSIIPVPIGANPALTITTLAERAVDHMMRENKASDLPSTDESTTATIPATDHCT